MEVPILVCSPSVGNTLGLPPPSCDPNSGERTHMGTSPTTKAFGQKTDKFVKQKNTLTNKFFGQFCDVVGSDHS